MANVGIGCGDLSLTKIFPQKTGQSKLLADVQITSYIWQQPD